MADLRQVNRQYRRVAEVSFAFGDISDVDENVLVDVPVGAIIVGGGLAIRSAFDATVTFSIGDRENLDGTDTAGVATRYASAVAADATGFTAFTLDGIEYDDSNSLILTPSAAVTTGEGFVVVEYVLADSGREVQPTRTLATLA